MAIVRSLRVYNFNFAVDSDLLNSTPIWYRELFPEYVVDGEKSSTPRRQLSNVAQIAGSPGSPASGSDGGVSSATMTVKVWAITLCRLVELVLNCIVLDSVQILAA